MATVESRGRKAAKRRAGDGMVQTSLATFFGKSQPPTAAPSADEERAERQAGDSCAGTTPGPKVAEEEAAVGTNTLHDETTVGPRGKRQRAGHVKLRGCRADEADDEAAGQQRSPTKKRLRAAIMSGDCVASSEEKEEGQHEVQADSGEHREAIAQAAVKAEQDFLLAVPVESTAASHVETELAPGSQTRSPILNTPATDTDKCDMQNSENCTASQDRANGRGQTSEYPEEMSTPADDNDFEMEREARIQRNQMLMAQLGLQGGMAGPWPTQPRPPRQKKKMQKPTRLPLEDTSNLPTRRSTRSRGPVHLEVLPSVAAGEMENPGGAEKPPLSISYDDSSVLRYICEEGSIPSTCCPVTVQAGRPEGASLKGFAALGRNFWDGGLTRAYGMDIGNGLIAAGGHQGRVAVWGLKCLGESDEDVEPLLSGRLHRGWICDVQFLGDHHSEMPLLLTASNDSTVSLWDLSKCGGPQRLPKKLMETDTIHSNGIFSMECLGVSVLTASKDSTAAVSRIMTEGAELQVERTVDAHNGVVKFATWRDCHTFASGGNDRSVIVHDLRAAQSTAVEIAQAHSGSANYGRWSPADPNLILSTGFDDALKVFDIRRPQSAWRAYRGHSQRSKSIYQPQWVDGGRGIATGGDTGLLSLYCLKTGMARSRGEIGFEPKATLLHITASAEETLFVATTKTVVAYSPKWGH